MDGVFQTLHENIQHKSALCGIIGLGYVGLPLAVSAARRGFTAIGFDIDPDKPKLLHAGHSYIESVDSRELLSLIQNGRFRATDQFSELENCDVIVICVPTPLTKQREPDLSYVVQTLSTIRQHLRLGQLVVLESTTYPGTTREVAKPILEDSGLKSERDFLLGFSPEREDPGNTQFSTVQIPKIVSGDGPIAAAVVESFYAGFVDSVVPVSSMDTAEAVKITENVFRAVNIALVNELKVIFDRMGIDIWEVVDAAKTKPFGFMPFYPGPGLGGHCIPIDPFYLTWKSREYEVPTRFIELAGEINVAMPRYVITKLEEALDRLSQKTLSGSRVLVLGVSYKKNIGDTRESPSLRLMDLLEARKVLISYHDPYVPTIPPTRQYAQYEGLKSEPLSETLLRQHDAVLIATDHDTVDYELVARVSPLVIDTRNACGRRGITRSNVVKA